MGQKIWPLGKPQHAAAASCSLAESLVLSLSVKTFYFWAAGESNPRLPAAWTVALLLLQLAACCRHGGSVSPAAAAAASVQSLQASASASVRLCDRESSVSLCVCEQPVGFCDVTAANALSRCSNMDCDSVSVALSGHSVSARPLVRTNAIFSLFGLLCWLKLFALFCFI